MTDEQMNQSIAKACGIVGKDNYGPLYQTPDGWVVDCPQFATDLNAMHIAEKHLFEARKDNAYGHQLATIECQTMWHVTARDRAEAFLRTLGKWEDGE
jgi:hypothetical protein